MSVQEIVNAVRDYESDLNNFDLPKIIDATGKDSVGAGVTTSITLTLLDGWKFNAQARATPTIVTVFGGNFITDDGSSPFFPITNVTYDRAQSTSGSLLQSQTIENLQQSVENQNISQGGGDTFYWDPVDGDDLADGKSVDTAVKTFSQAQSLVTSGENDVIYIRSPMTSNDVVVTELLVISKNNVHLRGLGQKVKFQPASGVAITVTGVNCEVSGFDIDYTSSTGTSFGIDVPAGGGHGLTIKNVRCFNTTDISLNLVGSDDCIIDTCFIDNSGGNGGICLADTRNTIVKDTISSNCVNDGFHITSSVLGASDNNALSNCTSFGNGGYGVNIKDSNVRNFNIQPDCDITAGSSGLGRLNDQGVNTLDGEILSKQVAVFNDIGHGNRSLNA